MYGTALRPRGGDVSKAVILAVVGLICCVYAECETNKCDISVADRNGELAISNFVYTRSQVLCKYLIFT